MQFISAFIIDMFRRWKLIQYKYVKKLFNQILFFIYLKSVFIYLNSKLKNQRCIELKQRYIQLYPFAHKTIEKRFKINTLYKIDSEKNRTKR